MLDDFFANFVPKSKRKDQRLLVLNGDIIDGFHHNTVNIVTNDISAQRKAAVKLIKKYLPDYDMAFVVRGTEAHVGQAAQEDDTIGKDIGAHQDENGDFSFWQLNLVCQNILFNFAHHIGVTSSTAYESSAPMREMVAGFVEAGQWGKRLPNYVVRSHRHRYVKVVIPSQYGDVESIITPGWQLRTPFVERIDRMRMPHIGGIVFVIEEGICTVKAKVYKLPEPEPILI